MIPLHLDDHSFRHLVRVTPRPIEYVDDIPLFGHMPLGWILHVTEGNSDPFGIFNRNVKGQRKNAHLWVAKNGQIEQFVPLHHQSWAQVDGNPDYWSVETQGFATEALTPRQINSLARIHRALEIASGRDYSHVINHPGAVGVGTHSMGGAAWGGHACPGTVREKQRARIIELAAQVKFQR